MDRILWNGIGWLVCLGCHSELEDSVQCRMSVSGVIAFDEKARDLLMTRLSECGKFDLNVELALGKFLRDLKPTGECSGPSEGCTPHMYSSKDIIDHTM